MSCKSEARFRAFSVVFAAAVATTARANPEHEAYKNPPNAAGHAAVATWLEPVYDTALSTCLKVDVPFTTGVINRKKITAIPKEIRTSLKVTSGDGPYVAELSTEKMALAFSEVFDLTKPGVDQNRLIASQLDADMQLQIPTAQDNAATKIGVSGVANDMTCTSGAKAALQAGVDLPGNALQLALQGDYDGSQSDTVSVVAGTFRSPILTMLSSNYMDGQDHTPDRFYAALILFDWYRKHPLALKNPTNGLRLLDSFDGIVIYKESGGKSKTDIGLSAGGNGNVYLLSISGKFEGNVSRQTNIVVHAYKVAYFADNTDPFQPVGAPPHANPVWSAMPTIKELQNVVDATTTAVFNQTLSDDTTIWDAKSKIIVQDVYNIPHTMCAGGGWRAEMNASSDAGNISVKNVKPLADIAITTCRISLAYTPPTGTGTTLSDDHDLNFVLASDVIDPAIDSANPASRLAAIKIPAAEVSLTGAHLPIVRGDSSVRTIGSLSMDKSAAIWSFNLMLEDRNSLSESGLVANASVVDLSNVALNCDDGYSPEVTPSILGIAANAGDRLKQMKVQFAATFDGNAHTGCKFQGHVAYELPVGRNRTTIPVQRPFPSLKVSFPAAPVAVTTVAPAGPGT